MNLPITWRLLFAMYWGALVMVLGCGAVETGNPNNTEVSASSLIWETHELDPAACTMHSSGVMITPWPGLVPERVRLASAIELDARGQYREGTKTLVFFQDAVNSCSKTGLRVRVTIAQSP